MVYGHANGIDDRRHGRRRCSALHRDGLPGDPRAVRGSRRRSTPTASAAARSTTSRPRRGCRSRASGAPSAISTSCRRCSSGCAREFGFDVHLLHDVHHRLTPIEAARLGKSLEPYRLFWMEDPVPAENQAAFRTIRQHTTTPIAVGEVFNTIYDCAQLIEEELIDYIRTTVVHAGGISHLRKIAALAELHHVRTGSHGATDLSPVAWRRRCTSISACTTSASRSTCATPPRPTACSRTPTRSSAARCIRATRPGSASTSTRRWRRRIPYDPAYLPVNRKLDGTVHSW